MSANWTWQETQHLQSGKPFHAGGLPWQVIRYLRMIAVITPYAQFRFAYRAEDERNSVRFSFVRRTDKMPAPPTVRTVESLSYIKVLQPLT